MRVLIHDFGGYAFPVTLSEALQNRGYDVGHAYCASLITTPLNVHSCSDNLTFLPIKTTQAFNKYNLVKRWGQEREYGHLAAQVILEFNPDIVISANTPLSAQQRIQDICRENTIPFIYWLQDLIGLATSKVLKSKLPLLAPLIGRYFQFIEGRLLRRSDAVIPITEDFSGTLQKFRVPSNRCFIIENWGILEKFHGAPSAWAKQNHLDSRPILLYAGTLSMKHNPETLLHLAQQIGEKTQVVVVSQGAGADWLKKAIIEHSLSNLIILPYQDSDQLSAMYSSATILLVLLTRDAGEFSVPSKVLTCLCAGRPILAAIPQENLAARIIDRAGAGFVIEPENHWELSQKAQLLLTKPILCQTMGEKACVWAAQRFDIDSITNQFEHILKRASK